MRAVRWLAPFVRREDGVNAEAPSWALLAGSDVGAAGPLFPRVSRWRPP